jgi:YVTN family beta-propeller protein
VTATIAAGAEPDAVAVDPTTHTLYVGNISPGTVTVINEATRTVTATITGVDSPWAIAVDPRTDAVYVISFDADVVAIDGATRAVTATIYPPGYGPLALAVDSTAGTVYVTDEEAVEGRANPGSVSVISEATNTVIGTITDGGGPEGVAVDSCRHAAYVANDGNGTVSVIKRSPASSASACP